MSSISSIRFPDSKPGIGRLARTSTNHNREVLASVWQSRLSLAIAMASAIAIFLWLILRFGVGACTSVANLPLVVVLILGGGLQIVALLKKAIAREFGSDLLAGISIVTSVLLGEYLVGTVIVLMLSGGTTLEHFATRKASSALGALARRMPQKAHRQSRGLLTEIDVSEIHVGDTLVVFPHEICPVDGVVIEGHGSMDEAYLTGEPFNISKARGSSVVSGAINGPTALTVSAAKLPVDSRYSQIVKVMESSEASRPSMRRMGDKLGAWYTPLSLAIAGLAGLASGSWDRFLAVLVIATPCPLIIAIPVAIIGAISVCARNGMVVKNAAALEEVGNCGTLILDKTGTLTYGKAVLAHVSCLNGFEENGVLGMAASLEQYSKHPLAQAILNAAAKREVPLFVASEVSEEPGKGLKGFVNGRSIAVVGRLHLQNEQKAELPAAAETGLECVVLVDGELAALLRFADEPRAESGAFVRHLSPKHGISRVVLLSGDRRAEVENLARISGISEIWAEETPEDKVRIVHQAARTHRTLFVGDGLNDAPAMKAATVGIAFGAGNDITAQAADIVILEPMIQKIDELMHIGRRMRNIALQSAVGGMALSVAGMIIAAAGYLPPIAGALTQEAIDSLAVINALRVLARRSDLADF